jgi:hypothetical protein
MRYLLSTLAMAAISAAAALPAHAGGNLVKNGSFETPVVPDASDQTFNTGDSFKGWTAAAQKHPDKNSGMLEAYSTDFILKTANNWQGGIGKFHLVIDKLKPGNVLSLCWDGTLAKTGPTTFAFDVTDFHPRQDLTFVVLE